LGNKRSDGRAIDSPSSTASTRVTPSDAEEAQRAMESELARRDLQLEAAEAASVAKSEFLTRMSHELRTPLNSVLAFAQLLRMEDLTPEQADCVDHILTASRHVLDLTEEVLDIARIESGHLELSMTSVPALEVTSEAVELTRPLAERTGVSLHIEIDPEPVLRVRADRQRLLQVLLNLLSNAVKYNQPGGRVVVTCDDAGSDRARLVVADTGGGIRPEDLWRVFEPFDRLGAELSAVEGTGVGLSLSRELTQSMGGRLDFESVPGRGSTFFVELDSTTSNGEEGEEKA
jgi:signal transduction histidine kinase